MADVSTEQLTRGTLDACFPALAPFAEPVRVSGGSLNFVWRVHCAAGSVIAKRAPPYVAAAPAILLSADRLLFEARALRLFDGGALAHLSSDAVRPPKLLGFSRRAWLLLEEDVGEGENLAAAPTSLTLFDRLGRFIAALHAESCDSPQLRRGFRNLAVQQTRLHSQYTQVAAFARRAAAADAARLGEAAVELGTRLLAPGRCLIMGDLWPDSLLLRGGGLRIIDWEFAHFGSPAQDVAHLLAHLTLQSIVTGEAAFVQASRAFVTGYRSALGARFARLWGDVTRRDAGLHFGCELLARGWGPFKASGPLADYDEASPAHRAATSLGLSALREPFAVGSLAPLSC